MNRGLSSFTKRDRLSCIQPCLISTFKGYSRIGIEIEKLKCLCKTQRKRKWNAIKRDVISGLEVAGFVRTFSGHYTENILPNRALLLLHYYRCLTILSTLYQMSDQLLNTISSLNCRMMCVAPLLMCVCL